MTPGNPPDPLGAARAAADALNTAERRIPPGARRERVHVERAGSGAVCLWVAGVPVRWFGDAEPAEAIAAEIRLNLETRCFE
jgi:hypothetical protein